MVLVQKKNVKQCNIIEYVETTEPIFTHLIFDKGAKTYPGEKTASLTNDAGKNCHKHVN